jgi:hypothetical protein
MADGTHIPDEHKAQHQRARSYLVNAIRRGLHANIPESVILRELIEALAEGVVACGAPLSETVAELIESYGEQVVEQTAGAVSTLLAKGIPTVEAKRGDTN